MASLTDNAHFDRVRRSSGKQTALAHASFWMLLVYVQLCLHADIGWFAPREHLSPPTQLETMI
jgi:hypothetical protein